jgi:hypothetical protein
MSRLFALLVLVIASEVAFAQAPEGDTAANIVGTWIGEWSSFRSGGRYEFEITSFDGKRIAGRVNSEAQACTVGWVPLSGTVVGEEIRGTYTIGRPCGKVDVVFPLPKGHLIEGKWTSEYPGYGTFYLKKRPK